MQPVFFSIEICFLIFLSEKKNFHTIIKIKDQEIFAFFYDYLYEVLLLLDN